MPFIGFIGVQTCNGENQVFEKKRKEEKYRFFMALPKTQKNGEKKRKSFKKIKNVLTDEK